MSILIITTGLASGGAERSLFRLIVNDEHNKYLVLSLNGDGFYGKSLRLHGVPVFDLNFKRPFHTIKVLLSFLKDIRKTGLDHIYGWMYHGSLVAIFMKFLLRNKVDVCINIRQCLYDIRKEKRTTQFIIYLLKLLSSIVDSVVYNSELSRLHHEAYGIVPAKSEVIFNGLTPMEMIELRAARCAVDKSCKRIGIIGRLHEVKDHATFIRGSVELAKQRSDVTFRIIGSGVVDHAQALLADVPEELHNKFIFCDHVVSLSELYRELDIVCLTSRAEGFPNVLLEAAYARKLLISTNVGDAHSIVLDDNYLIPVSDYSKLTETLDNLLDTYESTDVQNLLDERIRVIEESFLVDQMIEKYRKI